MLSYGQVRIALLQLHYFDKPIYNMSFNININGNLDLELFEKSLNIITYKHKGLRLNISVINDKLEDNINNSTIKIDKYYGDNCKEYINEYVNKPFNITQEILIKVLYVEKIQQIIFLFSDLIIDGQTIINYFNDLSIIYNSFYNNQLPQFKKINNVINKVNYDELLKFLENILNKDLSLKLKVKNKNKYMNESRISFKIENELLSIVKNKIKKYKINLFNYFTSLFLLLLNIISNEKYIVIDTLMCGDHSDKVGLFNNVILIPFLFNENIKNDYLDNYIQTCSIFLNKIKDNKIELEYLCNKLDFNSLPNIRIHFEYSNKNTEKEINFGDSILSSDMYENSSNTIRQLLIFNICEYKDYFECYISYNNECFDEEYINEIIKLYNNLIKLDNIVLKNIKNSCNNDYNIHLDNNLDKRLLAYKYAGKYPDINFSNFSNNIKNIDELK